MKKIAADNNYRIFKEGGTSTYDARKIVAYAQAARILLWDIAEDSREAGEAEKSLSALIFKLKKEHNHFPHSDDSERISKAQNLAGTARKGIAQVLEY
jgi:hypothetical protein